MADVVYRSEVVIERLPGGTRKAHLPAEREPVVFGMHDAIAEHYGKPEGGYEPHAATLDYIVAATGGWLVGTFGGALDARQIPATDGRLIARVTGEVELEEKVLVIKRIRVRLDLSVAEEHRATAERVHGFFAMACPVYRTLRSAIAITTELRFVGDGRALTPPGSSST